MKIAVDTRPLLREHRDGHGIFLFEILKRIVTLHPADEFLFLFDRPFPPHLILAGNVKAIIAGPRARHRLARRWWYDVKLPLILGKYQADVFLSGEAACSLRSKVPQCLQLHDLSFLQAKSGFYRKYMPRFIQKAAAILTVSGYSEREIISQYPDAKEKIQIAYKGVNDIFHPLPVEEQYLLRDQYTNGKNYFICVGPVHARKNLLNLLKAFSIFKKRQKSDWKLLLAGSPSPGNENFSRSLASYKYRDDLVLTGYPDERELARLVGAAYALVYTSQREGFGAPVAEAMRCGVPVVTGGGSAMEEIAGGAALYADTDSHVDIAEKMMMLYKDEALRERLIEKGKTVAVAYTWERTATLAWECLSIAAAAKTSR